MPSWRLRRIAEQEHQHNRRLGGDGTPFAINPVHPARRLEHMQPKLVAQFLARHELQ